jgi:hypothetical protein
VRAFLFIMGESHSAPHTLISTQKREVQDMASMLLKMKLHEDNQHLVSDLLGRIEAWDDEVCQSLHIQGFQHVRRNGYVALDVGDITLQRVDYL